MHSGYGGVSEIQQFMVESCGGPSLFSISPANHSSAAAPSPVPTNIHSAAAAASQPLKYHPLHHLHHANLHHQPLSLPPHFSHLLSIPITHQLFQQPHHQFQLFHHHQPHQPAPHWEARQQLILTPQLELDQDSCQENSASPTRMMGSSGGAGAEGPSCLAAHMSFKLAGNESSGGGSREGVHDDDGIVHGDDRSESRLHLWKREDECTIKEPSWRHLDIACINNNNKRSKENELDTSIIKYCKKSKEIAEKLHGHAFAGSSDYKVFSELEAIYKPGNNDGYGEPNQTAGSGSALTGEETPLMVAATTTATGLLTSVDHHVGGSSETSAGEDAPVKKFPKRNARQKRKRRRQQQLNSVAAFFENLVKQLIDHQEGFHKKFLEVMERRDQERTNREEAWRKQEAAKASQEAAARAHECAVISSHEASIFSFLEKITGQSLNLPAKLEFHPQFPVVEPNQENTATADNLQIEPFTESLNLDDSDGTKVMFRTNRWPKAEVQALIRVRSGLESRFQEPGLKGPIWEEVSSTLAAMGYQRSAKRCKEKWENINKYFRKSKESGRSRPQHSKTCPYFHQLDQFYSNTLSNKLPISSSSLKANARVACARTVTGDAATDQQKDSSELLDAIVESTDHQGRFDFNVKGNRDVNEATGRGTAAKVYPELHGHAGNNDEEDGEDNVEDCRGRGGGGEGEEAQGENQGH